MFGEYRTTKGGSGCLFLLQFSHLSELKRGPGGGLRGSNGPTQLCAVYCPSRSRWPSQLRIPGYICLWNLTFVQLFLIFFFASRHLFEALETSTLEVSKSAQLAERHRADSKMLCGAPV